MMNLTVFIVDDEEHAVRTLADYVGKTPGLTLNGTACDPLKALAVLTDEPPPDLVFLDVDMPGMSGIELAGLLSKNTRIIFVTSFREYGVEAFTLAATDYLLKPVSYPRFFQAIQKVREQQFPLSIKERSYFFVKGDVKEKYVKVFLDQIVYISAAQNYIEIFLPEGRLTTYLTLNEILGELPKNDFIQVQRSHIISRESLIAIEQGRLRMSNQHLIPLGKTYEASFFKWLDPGFLISKRLRQH